MDLAVREDLSISLARELRADELDLAFITVPGGSPVDGLELRVVSSEELVAVLPCDHELAGRGKLRVVDLEAQTIVAFGGGATIRQRLDEAATGAGFGLRVAFESNEVARMRALVAAGLAIAVLPRWDAEQPGPAITAVGFDEPDFTHTVYMAWRGGRHHSPAAQAFIDLTIAEHAADRPQL